MDRKDIPFLAASELAQLIKAREVSPVEVVEEHLQRIELIDTKLNAYITVSAEEARQAAKQAEEDISHGRYKGPMHGIPVAVKDQINTKGIRTTGGSPLLSDFVPAEDATVVAKLKNEGAILLGKTNMPEFAHSGASHVLKMPRNPWDLSLSPGRSSSGSGAATTAFLCSTSLGEDTGGSVRNPAAWCGLIGLRPSWGRVSRYGLMPGSWSQDAIGPLTRTVRDCAMTLQAIAGYDPKDPYTWNAPVPNYLGALNGTVNGLRVGVIREIRNSEFVDEEVQRAVEKAIDVLRELGLSVEEVSIPLFTDAWIISGLLLRVESASIHSELVRHRLRELGHGNQVGYLTGSLMPAKAYYKAQKIRSLLRQQVEEALERIDVLVLPTRGDVAQGLEIEPITDMKEEITRREVYLSQTFTSAFSLASTPALNICCGFTAKHLPIGLQLGTKPFAEEILLKVAYAYEQNTPWHTRKPPI